MLSKVCLTERRCVGDHYVDIGSRLCRMEVAQPLGDGETDHPMRDVTGFAASEKSLLQYTSV